MRSFAAMLAATVVVVPAGPPPRPPPVLGPLAEVQSVFFIAKSENKNQIHFAVGVDAHCVPRSAEPVVARWRMLEVGPDTVEPLRDWEQPAYGIDRQRITERGEHGGTISMALRALPKREITVTTSTLPDGSCAAEAKATIAEAPAIFLSVYVKLGFLSVSWIRLEGRTADGLPVSERVDP